VTLKYAPINWWFNGPELLDNEEVVAYFRGQMTQHGLARAGILFFTNQRMIFVPSRVEVLLGARCWSTKLADLVEVGHDRPRLSPFRFSNGGFHERLFFATASETTRYFVLPELHRINAILPDLAPGAALSLDAISSTRHTSRLLALRANTTWKHLVLLLSCAVVAIAVICDGADEKAWVMSLVFFINPFMLAPSLRDLFLFNRRITIQVTTAVALTSIALGLVLHLNRPSSPASIQALSLLASLGLGMYISIQLALRSDFRLQLDPSAGATKTRG